jgi:sRNA-binding carbon storage regulator CsrA
MLAIKLKRSEECVLVDEAGTRIVVALNDWETRGVKLIIRAPKGVRISRERKVPA